VFAAGTFRPRCNNKLYRSCITLIYRQMAMEYRRLGSTGLKVCVVWWCSMHTQPTSKGQLLVTCCPPCMAKIT
jgi:hypothetical protein